MNKLYRCSLLMLPLILLIASTTHVMAQPETVPDTSEPNSTGLGFDLYRTPAIPQPTAAERAKNCYALEQEMTAQIPKTYSYKPDFYSDPYQGASIWIGTTLFMPVYALSAYSGYKQYGENARIITAEERIALLRHLKAQNHCFET